MRILKMSAIALVALVLILLVAAAILIARFDPNDYKPQLTALLEERTGRSIAIDDDIGWTLFPWLAVTTGGITIGNHPDLSPAPFATVEQLSARVRVWPLLRRRFELGVIEIDGLSVDLGTDANGVANWSDLLQTSETATRDGTQAPASDSSPLERIDLAGIRLRNGRMLWRELGEVRFVIGDVSLTTGPIADGDATDLDLAFSLLDVASQRRAAVEIDTTARYSDGSLQLTGIRSDTTLTDAAGNVRGTATVATATLSVDQQRRIEISDGSFTATLIDPPVGPADIDAQLRWPAATFDPAAARLSVSDPRPGMTNTLSVTTTPLIRMAIAMPMTVTIGTAALRRACLTRTFACGSPLARAVRT